MRYLGGTATSKAEAWRHMAMLLGHTPTLDRSAPQQLAALAHWPTHPSFGDRDLAALALTEQYLLDVMKWSHQKTAVALGTDPQVNDGMLTDLVFDANGDWVR